MIDFLVSKDVSNENFRLLQIEDTEVNGFWILTLQLPGAENQGSSAAAKGPCWLGPTAAGSDLEHLAQQRGFWAYSELSKENEGSNGIMSIASWSR